MHGICWHRPCRESTIHFGVYRPLHWRLDTLIPSLPLFSLPVLWPCLGDLRWGLFCPLMCRMWCQHARRLGKEVQRSLIWCAALERLQNTMCSGCFLRRH